MKKPVSRVLRFVVGYYAVAFMTAFISVLVVKDGTVLIPVFKTAYLINRALQLFIAALPAVQVSALLIAFSWYFKDFFADGEILKTALRGKILKSVFIVVILSLVVSTAAFELGWPLLRSARRSMQTASADYDDFMNFARALANGKQYNQAEPFVQQALAIYPASEEALYLKRLIEDKLPDYVPPAEPVTEFTLKSPAKGLSFAELMQKAREAFAARSYIDAHYYSTLALQNPDTHSSQEARIIAADSWNKIAAPASSGIDDAARLFARKKQGYEYILQKDYLPAYYLFNDLNERYPLDPDVQRYLALAAELLLAECFFIDETYNLQPFEKMRNVYFSLSRPDGGLDVVYINGLTRLGNAAGLVQYLRGLQIVSFDAEKRFDFNLSVDYAKVLSERVQNLDSSFKSLFKDPLAPASTVPVIQLVSVDRKTQGVVKMPVYAPPEKKGDFFNTHLLYMPYEDFLLVTEASAGADEMPLASLWRFVFKAERYGYSFEVFYQTLCSRLCLPLSLLILTMLAVTFAWRYRLMPGSVIKFRWLFMLPFCTALCYVIIEFSLYLFKLLMYTLIGFLKLYALPAALVCLILIFAVIVFAFAAQTHE